ncbi:hypothetical protein BFW01_g8270 [Lasiodiplodia theobromae]|uniref:Lpxtg-domain-containing protein cell wall anchor domain n=1 Tax=Lasiodiplodia theobromae TaxID=45133 RepID=UPI0015C30FF4|nr:Lpxtg-domain-containing protein cell wall anchor domain [Lasiodiplodia theobromae]KAF4538937.1 Lpxtg-domain-containing protein cell wall anchor domain [Lasiodiplodia theobromae]KAF9637374.1 hypothetical protein BFW01_g8270 [Lasiodiplodia theobromae]
MPDKPVTRTLRSSARSSDANNMESSTPIASPSDTPVPRSLRSSMRNNGNTTSSTPTVASGSTSTPATATPVTRSSGWKRKVAANAQKDEQLGTPTTSVTKKSKTTNSSSKIGQSLPGSTTATPAASAPRTSSRLAAMQSAVEPDTPIADDDVDKQNKAVPTGSSAKSTPASVPQRTSRRIAGLGVMQSSVDTNQKAAADVDEGSTLASSSSGRKKDRTATVSDNTQVTPATGPSSSLRASSRIKGLAAAAASEGKAVDTPTASRTKSTPTATGTENKNKPIAASSSMSKNAPKDNNKKAADAVTTISDQHTAPKKPATRRNTVATSFSPRPSAIASSPSTPESSDDDVEDARGQLTPTANIKTPGAPASWSAPMFRHNDLHKWLIISDFDNLADATAALAMSYMDSVGGENGDGNSVKDSSNSSNALLPLPRRVEFLLAFDKPHVARAVKSLRAMCEAATGDVEKLLRELKELEDVGGVDDEKKDEDVVMSGTNGAGSGDDGLDVVPGAAGEEAATTDGDGGAEPSEAGDDHGRRSVGEREIRAYIHGVVYNFKHPSQLKPARDAYIAAKKVAGTTERQAHAAVEEAAGKALAQLTAEVEAHSEAADRVDVVGQGPSSSSIEAVATSSTSTTTTTAEESTGAAEERSSITAHRRLSSRRATAPANNSSPSIVPQHPSSSPGAVGNEDEQQKQTVSADDGDVDMTDPFIEQTVSTLADNLHAKRGKDAEHKIPLPSSVAELVKQHRSKPVTKMSARQMRNEIMRKCSLRERLVVEGWRLRALVAAARTRRDEQNEQREPESELSGEDHSDGPSAQLRDGMTTSEERGVDKELLALVESVVGGQSDEDQDMTDVD